MAFTMTDNQSWLSRRYLLYRACTSLWFFSAVWLYFYRLFITDQQVGLLDGMAFAIGLIAEVPSGALADKFGRDKMVRLGQLLVAVGILTQVFNDSFLPLFVGQGILMVGLAFVSGADDALFFEKLGFAPNSTKWRKLVTRGSQAALSATLLATIIGGWLHTIDPRMPWILTATVLSVASFLRMVPYVCLAPIIGFLSSNDRLEFFLIPWALVICGAILLYALRKHSDTSIAVHGIEQTEPVV